MHLQEGTGTRAAAGEAWQAMRRPRNRPQFLRFAVARRVDRDRQQGGRRAVGERTSATTASGHNEDLRRDRARLWHGRLVVGVGERDPANDGAPGMMGQARPAFSYAWCYRCVIIVLIFIWVVLCTNLCTLQRTYVCPPSIFISLTRIRFQVSLLVKSDDKFVFVCGHVSSVASLAI